MPTRTMNTSTSFLYMFLSVDEYPFSEVTMALNTEIHNFFRGESVLTALNHEFF